MPESLLADPKASRPQAGGNRTRLPMALALAGPFLFVQRCRPLSFAVTSTSTVPRRFPIAITAIAISRALPEKFVQHTGEPQLPIEFRDEGDPAVLKKQGEALVPEIRGGGGAVHRAGCRRGPRLHRPARHLGSHHRRQNCGSQAKRYLDRLPFPGGDVCEAHSWYSTGMGGGGDIRGNPEIPRISIYSEAGTSMEGIKPFVISGSEARISKYSYSRKFEPLLVFNDLRA